MKVSLKAWQDLTPLLRQGLSSLRALGWPGLAALLCLGLAGVLALHFTPRWQAQADERAVQQAQLRRSLRAQGLPTTGPDTPATFLAALPPAEARQQRLADLLEMAVRLGLVVQRSEQHLAVEPGSGLERLRVSLPVQGRYAVLRQYLGAALAHDPALSLDSLHLRRPQRDAQELQADLVWTLHSRTAPPATTPPTTPPTALTGPSAAPSTGGTP